MKTGEKINRFFETTLGQAILWTVEIIAVIVVFCTMLYASASASMRFTPEQMELFHRIIDNKSMNVVVFPWLALMCAGFVLVGYMMLNLYRWLERSEIKELKLKIQELERETA